MNLLSLNPKYILILVLPISVLLAGEMIIASLSAHPVMFDASAFRNETPFTPDVLAIEAAARIRMLGLLFLLTVISIGIIWRWNSERIDLFDGRSSNLLIAGVIVSVVAGAAVIGLALWGFGIPRTFDVIGSNVFDAAFRGIANQPGQTDRNPITVDNFNWMINLSGIMVAVAVGCLIATSISCLASQSPMPVAGSDAEKAHWKFQSERLQHTLYIATGLLVVGILFIDSWTHWPAFVFKPAADKVTIGPDSGAAFKALASNAVAFTGIHYSLLLASFALPVVYLMSKEANLIARNAVLNRRAQVAREQTGSKGPPAADSATPSRAEIEAEKESEKLKLSLLDQTKAIVAILAPFVAGTIGNFASLASVK